MNSGDSPSIKLENISVNYGRKPIFKNLSIEFEEGACTCVLGPSGCGKSTLLKMISGNPEIEYSGKIRFSGKPLNGQLCGWMSQKDLLLPWMTVQDNVLLGAKLRNEIDDTLIEKSDYLLHQAGLGDYRKELPSVLSGGMRQRVALLRTLIEDRPVFLMDEPFSALDALNRLKLQDLSATLTSGKTVVLVTHDPLEALRIAQKIVVVAGTPARVVKSFSPAGDTPRQSSDVLGQDYHELLQSLLSTP